MRGHGFGWTTPCPVGSHEQSVRHVEGLWAAYFPAEAGYVVTRRVWAGGLRLAAHRGDFQAEVEVAGGRRRGGARLRLSGCAGSQRVAVTERVASAVVERLRLCGSLLGAGFVGVTASRLLVTPPELAIGMLHILGGLMLVVMLMVVVMTGAGLGGWLGEQRAASRWAATSQAVAADTGLHTDLRRWRAVVRSLAQHRDALSGGLRGLPFRCEFNESQVGPQVGSQVGPSQLAHDPVTALSSAETA
ncbi:hypothetical protein [Nannocystis sp.]|nr:hypothetical protein [Nannocystis sp.]MBK7823707.1 hypothetical protein [Nannocystis sp.]